MTHSELVRLISDYKSRLKEKETFDIRKAFQHLASEPSLRADATKYLQEGIRIYQQTEDYFRALSKIDQSLQIFPTAEAYYNRGLIHWTEQEFYGCFKDQCAALIFDREAFPFSYFYLANALYTLADKYETSTLKDEKTILDFIIENLREGQLRGDIKAAMMIGKVLERRQLV